ncbi:DUF2934 domain-containing protein [Methylophilus aquaticus]|uniref:DUF2934 domain-containing protein n=1 Tax=Methylophilus aquaticus TaxID=1971610 RepID=A0ABT9JRV6_9PROT|nr:DUF2934 domain-containing protein [Methylophilus aquaticus]MDP8567261.1 DUF2934 domain-containing protein [Methylophilus aquaticus]
MATTETTGKKTSPAKKAAAKTAAPKAKSAATRKKAAKPSVMTSEERYKMIETAAYYIAEKNGFNTNHMDHWLAAELEVDAKLNGA